MIPSLKLFMPKFTFLESWRRMSTDGVVNVFDRKIKRLQKNRACMNTNPEVYDYLKDAIAEQVVDKVCDVKREFSLALDLGCGRGHISKHLNKDIVKSMVMCDMAQKPLLQAKVPDVVAHKVLADEELLPFTANTFDLITTSASLHWVNDLPRAFSEIRRVLKPDACVIGSMFCGDTLYELRCSLQLAQEEKEGGLSPHVSPFTQLRDIGSLLTGSGLVMVTIDTEDIVIKFPSIIELMHDLQGMGENNAVVHRPRYLRRGTLQRAKEIYREMYGDDDGIIPATFQISYFIAWKPHPSQQKSAKRGSATVSLKELGKLNL